jgi:hypothetical protein
MVLVKAHGVSCVVDMAGLASLSQLGPVTSTNQ